MNEFRARSPLWEAIQLAVRNNLSGVLEPRYTGPFEPVEFPAIVIPTEAWEPVHDLQGGGYYVTGLQTETESEPEHEVDPTILVGLMPPRPIPPLDPFGEESLLFLSLLNRWELPIPGPGVTFPDMLGLMRGLVLLRNLLMDPMQHSDVHFSTTPLAAWLNASLQILGVLSLLVRDAESSVQAGGQLRYRLDRFLNEIWPHLSQFLPPRQAPAYPPRRRARTPDSEL